MIRIASPKPITELIKEIGVEKVIPLLYEYKATNDKGKYLHWNEMKWRVKGDKKPEAVWLATKFSRMGIRKNIPQLIASDTDAIQTHFHYCVPDSLAYKLHILDQSTGGGFSLNADLFSNKSSHDRYLVKSLIMEEAITSSQLEGACTTRKIAKDMLESKRPPRDKSERMIVNNYALMKHAVENKDKDLSIPLILEFHKIATFDAIENNAIPGEFRSSDDVHISNNYDEVAHYPPTYKSINKRIISLCEFANSTKEPTADGGFMHPAIRAIILHFMIGYIHPFGDGNGRTARALFYWSMLKSGYWIFEYVSISKQIHEKRSEYDKAFYYTESDEFDLTYFLYHQMEVINLAVDSLHRYLNEKRKEFYEFTEWVDKSTEARGLHRVALEILKEAVKEPGRTFTVYQVALNNNISENTARFYLQALERKDYLHSSLIKGTKTKFYIAPSDLREKLRPTKP